MVEAPEKTAPRLFLIDAYALIYRAFFAFINRPLTNSRGENTSAPWGFINFLIRIREELEPDYLAVVFDAGTSEREEAYPEYKATREKMPDELEASLPRIRAILDAFHDRVVEVEGYEADDVIGTLAMKARDAGLEAVIVSGDKDFYQLVGRGVHLLNPGRGGPSGVAAEWVDESNAAERLGVPPERVVDYLGLIGDSSDNVPGAPGIGPKTAIKLLEEYGSIDALLERADEISGKRARESLQENAEQVRLSRRLVTIRKDVPIELDLERLRVREPDRAALREILIELEFRSLIDRYAAPAASLEAPAGEGERARFHLLTEPEEVAALVERIRALEPERREVSIDTETTSLNAMEASLVGISLSFEEGEAYYLPFAHRRASSLDLLEESGGDAPVPNLPPLEAEAMRPLRELIEDASVRKIGQNLKYDMIVLRRCGLQLGGIWFDTMVASYVLDPSRRQHGLDALATDFLRYTTVSYEEVCGKGRKEIPFSEVPLEKARDYACEDAECALRLKACFEPQLREQKLEELFHSIEMPLVPVLARMEENGIRIDTAFFGEMARRLEDELRSIEREIHELAGEPFNLNSTIQLREVLFEKLELPVVRRTKTGPSTDVSVLEELAAQGHEIPRRMMEYRQLEKLRGTYVDALPRLVNARTRRLHTSFNQTVAATGRLSSSDPNLQNIPVRTEVGREIRRGFIPEEGSVFLAADYSQIELRILAHFSGDEAFVTAFREGIDVHRQTAAVIFDLPVAEVTAEMRARAKTINFGTLYGQGEFSLAQQLGISREEAGDFIAEYFRRFAGVRRFLDEQVELAKERGYAETLSGRRRYIPELASRNWNVRQFGERVAQNTPIQGTAADMIKMAMITIDRALAEGEAEGKLLLQVHDELVFEVPEGEVDPLRTMVVGKMEGAMELDVPLAVEWGVGRNWLECKG